MMISCHELRQTQFNATAAALFQRRRRCRQFTLGFCQMRPAYFVTFGTSIFTVLVLLPPPKPPLNHQHHHNAPKYECKKNYCCCRLP
jgi:hypothetical protein